MDFCDSSVGKESASNAGDPISIPGSGRFSGEEIGYWNPVYLGFTYGSAGEESAFSVGDLGWEDALVKGKATDSSILAMDYIVHGVQDRHDSDFHFGPLQRSEDNCPYITLVVHWNQQIPVFPLLNAEFQITILPRNLSKCKSFLFNLQGVIGFKVLV